MTQRSDWTFEYGIEEVKNAAEKKVTYHGMRLGFWKDEKEKVLAAIEESGLNVRMHPQTGGDRAEVIIDPTHQTRLSECEQKIKQHQGMVEQYEGWAQVLHARVMQNDQRTLHLDYEDIRYFGLDWTEDGNGTGPDPE